MRVAIVDDEHLVRLGIQTYLASANRTFEIAGVYSDGGTALAALRAEHEAGRTVDILITDIRMPVMNGIELTDHCRAEGLARYVVILSCHDEFELVREAFTRGADEYVLKHEVEQDQLVTVLDRVTGGESTAVSAAEAFVAMEPAEGSSPGRSERLADLDPDLPVMVTAYRFCHQYTDDVRVVPWQHDTASLDTEVAAALKPFAPAVHLPGRRGGVLILGLRSPNEFANERRVRKACEAVLARVRRYWNREMQFWITPEPRMVGELGDPPGTRELHAVWAWGIYHPGDAVISGPEPLEVHDDPPTVPYFHLGERDIPGVWVTAINEYLRAAEAQRMPASHLYLSISGILHQLDQDLMHTVGKSLHDVARGEDDSRSEPSGSLVQQLEEIDRIPVISQWLTAILDRVSDALVGAAVRNSQIGRVLAFLDDTYREPLDLEALAKRFSISKAYLCSRIRSETGLTLSQHINRRRIARARELLRTSSMSAKEVCFAVGYDNPNYFSRVFKSVASETVTEFRNAVNEQRNRVRGEGGRAPLL